MFKPSFLVEFCTAMSCVRRVNWGFDNEDRIYEDEVADKLKAFYVGGGLFFQVDPWNKTLIKVVGDCGALTSYKASKNRLESHSQSVRLRSFGTNRERPSTRRDAD